MTKLILLKNNGLLILWRINQRRRKSRIKGTLVIISKIEINFANDMDEKTIKETLLKGERVTLECKKATAEVPKSIWLTFLVLFGLLGGQICGLQ